MSDKAALDLYWLKVASNMSPSTIAKSITLPVRESGAVKSQGLINSECHNESVTNTRALWQKLSLLHNEKWIWPHGVLPFESDILAERPSTFGSCSARAHAPIKESTQGPSVPASTSWVCLLQISGDIVVMTVTEGWGDDWWLRFCNCGQKLCFFSSLFLPTFQFIMMLWAGNSPRSCSWRG